MYIFTLFGKRLLKRELDKANMVGFAFINVIFSP